MIAFWSMWQRVSLFLVWSERDDCTLVQLQHRNYKMNKLQALILFFFFFPSIICPTWNFCFIRMYFRAHLKINIRPVCEGSRISVVSVYFTIKLFFKHQNVGIIDITCFLTCRLWVWIQIVKKKISESYVTNYRETVIPLWLPTSSGELLIFLSPLIFKA